MVGIRSFPIGARPIFRGELLVFGRVGVRLPGHLSTKQRDRETVNLVDDTLGSDLKQQVVAVLLEEQNQENVEQQILRISLELTKTTPTQNRDN